MKTYKELLGPPELSLVGRAKNVALGFLFSLLWVSLMIVFITTFHESSITPAVSVFLYSCVLAPLWEEIAFRHGPLQLAKAAGDHFVLPVAFISSAWFGWMHGAGVYSIMLQGVMGFVMAMVYIKNGFNYWSSVSLHFLWNFFLVVLLPIYRS